MNSQDAGIERIRRLARHAERRIRLRRALGAAARSACAGLLVAIVAVGLRKLGVLGELPARILLGLAGTGVVVAAAAGWSLRLPSRAGARALDRFHGLHDRLASALAFAEQSSDARSAFMAAAIDDAVAAVEGAQPRRAVPIPVPRSLAG